MKRILKLLPHVVIVISGMLVVFFVIDRVNKPMGFMTNEFHKRLTFCLALLSIGQSVFIASYLRKKERYEAAKKARAKQGQPPRAAAAPRENGRAV